MRVTIVDLDWYNKLSFLPNPICMKLSSYYKQQQVLINFAQSPIELKYDADLIYVVREKDGGSFPEELDIRDDRVKLIGKGMRFYDKYYDTIDEVILGCRPDYMLYPLREENKMAKAEFVQFFHEGHLLTKFQDYHRAYTKTKITYVTDKDFWEYKKEDLEKCCEKLKNDSNVVFQYPVKLDLLLQDKVKTKMMLNLHIDYSKQEIVLDHFADDNIEKVIVFFKKMREKKCLLPKVVCTMSFQNHFGDNGVTHILEDFYKYYSLIIKLKQEGIHMYFKSPSRFNSPFWFLFEQLERWTYYCPFTSFFSMMTYSAFQKVSNTMSFIEFLNNDIYWNEDVIQLAYLWRKLPDLMKTTSFLKKGNEQDNYIDFTKYIRIKWRN